MALFDRNREVPRERTTEERERARAQRAPRRAAPRGADAPSVVLDDELVDDWSALDGRPSRPTLAHRVRARRRNLDGAGGGPPGLDDAPAGPSRRRRWPAVFAVLALVVVA